MHALLAIIGSSGSGKSTLARELARSGHVRLLPTWTTRPLRVDELGSDGCPEHCFLDDAEFSRLERSGFFLASGVLPGLGYRYGLPELPGPCPGLIDVVIIRAAYVDRLRALAGRPVLVYQVESDLDTLRARVEARELLVGEVDVRTMAAEQEMQTGRRVADRVFVNTGAVQQLAGSVLGALQWDTALYEQPVPALGRPRPVWVRAPRTRWHWVGTAVACAVAGAVTLAGLLTLASMVLGVVAMGQMGSNK